MGEAWGKERAFRFEERKGEEGDVEKEGKKEELTGFV